MLSFVLLGIVACQIPQIGKGMCYAANKPKPTPPAPAAKPTQPPQPSTQQSYLPGGFKGTNKGIGSFFSASKNSDATNGRSWCSFPYKDYSNGFAPDLSVMTGGTNAVYGSKYYESSGRQYCGLEAKVTNLDNGVSKLMYIIDAFDPKYVRTPGSIDIMKGAWEALANKPANDKNVVLNVQWELTGNRNPQYAFQGKGDP